MKHILTAVTLMLVTLSAAAQQPAPPMGRGMGMPTFADFDLNGDGVITEQEFVEARNKRISERASEGRPMRGLSQIKEFKDIDTNHDGRITQEEFNAHQQQRMQNRPMGPGPAR